MTGSIFAHLTLGPVILAALAVMIAVLLHFSITIVGGDQIAVLERRYFGKEMPNGRVVAMKNEVCIQARTLAPGFHMLVPFL